MAISANGENWFIVNSSPDLAQQIQAFSSLHPNSLRSSPIEAVLLTNGDLDHVLGLYLLREGQPLVIHTTPAIRSTLEHGLQLHLTLEAYCGLVWHSPSFSQFSPLLNRDGRPSGLSSQAVALPSSPPPFARRESIGGIHGLAYLLRDDQSQRKVLIAPDVGQITPELEAAWQDVDALFLDGTFWSDDELQAIKPLARTAREIGHVPIFPEVLEKTSGLKAITKVFLHINNTNPIWDPISPERQLLEGSGWKVGFDGWECLI